jgi:hypothetical protein
MQTNFSQKQLEDKDNLATEKIFQTMCSLWNV